MRKSILLFVLLMTACGLVYAGGWSMVDFPQISGRWVLTGVDFISPDQGAVCGMNIADKTGLIYFYEGGGWKEASLPAVSGHWELRRIDLVTESEGWAFGMDIEGNKGVILHYSGGSWSKVEVPEVKSDDWVLLGSYFLNKDEGWAAGGSKSEKGAVVLHYKDGMWTSEGDAELLKGHLLHTVWAFSPTDVWCAGQNEGHFYTTGLAAFTRPWGTFEIRNNSGSWAKADTPLLMRNFIRKDYYFFDANDGWSVGFFPLQAFETQGKIAHWNGKKWAFEKIDDSSKNYNLYAAAFSSKDYGWAVGTDGKRGCGSMYEYNKGKWTLLKEKQMPAAGKNWLLQDIVFDGSKTFWAVGFDIDSDKGTVLKLEK